VKLDSKRVSVDVTGDYCQALFDSEDREDEQVAPFEQPAPYLLLQRQFECFDGGICYIESHDEENIGHFKLTLLEFSPARLVFEIANGDHKHVEVSFALTAAEFEETLPLIEVLFGVKDPSDDYDISDCPT
jgi:hypothetical protein